MALKDKANAKDAFTMLKTDDLFDPTGPDTPEVIVKLSLIDLYPFKDHPFRTYSEEKMAEMVQSVARQGVLSPIIVRPNPGGDGYEIISGHNRVEASKRAMLSEIPAIVRELDDDAAVILMVDSNLRQRDQLLPSEKAFAYKMKLEAIKRQGQRSDLTSGQVDQRLSGTVSRDLIANQAGESSKQIHRFIRLTSLNKDLLEYVDGGQMSFGPAVALSFLPVKEQDLVREIMEREQMFPSLAQAQRLKELSEKETLDWSAVNAILSEEKPQQQPQVVLKSDRISKFFPKSFTPQQIEEHVYKLIEAWYRHQQQNQSVDR